MKKHSFIFIFLFIFLCLCLTAHQQIQAQENKQQIQEKTNHVNFQHIISKLTFTSRISKSTEQINEELIKEINERKVDFILNAEDKEELKKAGASDLLIKAIDKNLPVDIEKRIKEEEKKDKYLEEVRVIYKKFTDNYRGGYKQKKIALEAAKEFVEKYGDDEEFNPQIEYLKRIILESVPPKPNPRFLNYEKFDQAYKAKKWNELFEIGEEILKNEPEFVDIAIILASVGYDKIAKKNPKSEKLTEAVYYAEKAIDLLKTTKSKTKMYGEYDYVYKTEEFPDGKANALGWMNYIIGYIKYFHLNEKEAAIPYFQKSLEYKSEVKKFAETMPIPKD